MNIPKVKDLDFKLVKAWLSIENIKEELPSLDSFKEKVFETINYESIMKNLSVEEYKKNCEAYIINFYEIASKHWEELKKCSTYMETFQLMLQIVGDTVSKNTGIPNY